ncbi:MAG: calcium/sodium antiporter [Alkaliphilus sp.]|nr:calcium/sodium antiporter [Alkaliphilus sp.]
MFFILLIISFIIIIKAANLLIDAAIDLAGYLGISQFVIGLTVVAFGTSAPEAAVNIIASLQNKSDIALGNIVGSNILNIGLVIGITALIFTMKTEWTAIRIDIPFAFVSSLVFGLLVLDGLSKNDGIILALFFFIYLNYLWITGKSSYLKNENLVDKDKKISKVIVMLFSGMVGVVLGGQLIVHSSVNIATSLGYSEAFIGLTIVSLGTSLPELITCVTACYKKSDSIAVGNMVGSNIFNILFVLSLSSVISPIAFNNKFVFDLAYMVFITFMLFVFSYTQKRISRFEGFCLSVFYTIYFMIIFIRS